jgi:hypothetical protein
MQSLQNTKPQRFGVLTRCCSWRTFTDRGWWLCKQTQMLLKQCRQLPGLLAIQLLAIGNALLTIRLVSGYIGTKYHLETHKFRKCMSNNVRNKQNDKNKRPLRDAN